MQKFYCLSELFDYCRKCYSCKNNRDIQIAVGPDDYFKCSNFRFDGTILSLPIYYDSIGRGFYRQHSFDYNRYYEPYSRDYDNNNCSYFQLEIDCINNTFYSSGQTVEPFLEIFNFWFAIYANCIECNNSVNSLDMSARYIHKQSYAYALPQPDQGVFNNIGIEQESIYLIKTKDLFHISLHPLKDQMLVTRLSRDSNGKLIDNTDAVTLPLVKLDFSNEPEVVDQINYMLTFH